MRGADPVGLPGIVCLLIGLATIGAAVIGAARRAGRARGGERSRVSLVGIVLQAAAGAIVAIGPVHTTLQPLSAKAMVEAIVVAVLMAGAVLLFAWAARTMGRAWSLVARTRDDHRLVEAGPFAYVRHPIYVALVAVILAIALALGHAGKLLLALPVYAAGTALRVVAEERLLRLRFGPGYDLYARRVTRFFPGLF